MIVEVIAVGTELLLGQIVNSNASTIGAALAEHGHDAHFQQVVGDNQARIVETLRIAMGRAAGIIVTGGLGPTQDDITREAVAEATGWPLVFSESYADHLRQWWARRGREMPESNLTQAYHPQGAELLPNPRGTAPGLALEHDGVLIFCIPGVPAEMEHLLHHEVLPRLAKAAGDTSVLVSRLLRTWGRSESDVAEILDDLYRGSTNPSVAFLASAGEIKVRITAKAPDEEAALALVEPMEGEIRSRLGSIIFGVDDETIEKVLLRLLQEEGYTIGTAESMTGGLVSAALTSVPGSSAVVRGGIVAYHQALKQQLLGVEDISQVVNVETAEEMARGGRSLLDVDVAVAVTGSAGPEPLEKPPGTAVIGVSTPEDTRAKELRLPGDRERVRAYATTAALHLTRRALIGEWWRR
ncbi:MAG: competence/damage-inducible protein A [Acidimicrobiia bacterium]